MSAYVVASSSPDPVAGWVAGVLSQMLAVDVVHITTANLGRARRWTQCITSSGVAESTLEFADGRVLSSETVRVLYNRLTLPPEPPLGRVVDHDREYAVAEMHAATLSWLGLLADRVINRPHPVALSGDSWSRLEWAAAALAVGLPVVTEPEQADGSPRQHAIVVGDQVAGAPQAWRMAPALLALRSRSGLDVLGVDLVQDARRWSVAAVTALPDLRRGGRVALAALADLVRERAQIGAADG